VAGRDALDFAGADVVPEREVHQVVLHRPAIERGFAHQLVAEAVDGGEELLARPAVVL